MWIGTSQGLYLGGDRRSLLIIAAAEAAPATAATNLRDRLAARPSQQIEPWEPEPEGGLCRPLSLTNPTIGTL